MKKIVKFVFAAALVLLFAGVFAGAAASPVLPASDSVVVSAPYPVVSDKYGSAYDPGVVSSVKAGKKPVAEGKSHFQLLRGPDSDQGGKELNPIDFGQVLTPVFRPPVVVDSVFVAGLQPHFPIQPLVPVPAPIQGDSYLSRLPQSGTPVSELRDGVLPLREGYVHRLPLFLSRDIPDW